MNWIFILYYVWVHLLYYAVLATTHCITDQWGETGGFKKLRGKLSFFLFCPRAVTSSLPPSAQNSQSQTCSTFFTGQWKWQRHRKGDFPLWNSKLQNTAGVLQVMARSRVFFNRLHRPWHACGFPGFRQPYSPSIAPQLVLVMLYFGCFRSIPYPKVFR